MFHIFIKRPLLSAVISILIMLLGILALLFTSYPISRYRSSVGYSYRNVYRSQCRSKYQGRGHAPGTGY